jgi:hypothetical protein
MFRRWNQILKSPQIVNLHSKCKRELTVENLFQAILIHMDKSILAATDVFGQTAFHLAAAAGNLVALQMMYSLDTTLLLQATRAGSNAAHLAALRYVTLLF